MTVSFNVWQDALDKSDSLYPEVAGGIRSSCREKGNVPRWFILKKVSRTCLFMTETWILFHTPNAYPPCCPSAERSGHHAILCVHGRKAVGQHLVPWTRREVDTHTQLWHCRYIGASLWRAGPAAALRRGAWKKRLCLLLLPTASLLIGIVWKRGCFGGCFGCPVSLFSLLSWGRLGEPDRQFSTWTGEQAGEILGAF